MSQQEAAHYYRGREQKQRLLAERAADPAIEAIHCHLADLYVTLRLEAERETKAVPHPVQRRQTS